MGLLIRLLLFVLMVVGVYTLVRRLLASAAPQPAPQPGPHPETPRPVSQLVQDPNCGVYLDVKDAVARRVGNGQLFFCSTACADAWMTKRQGA